MTDSIADARATLRTVILGDLIREMPPASYEYLEKVTEVAIKALETPSIRWAIKCIEEHTNDNQPG